MQLDTWDRQLRRELGWRYWWLRVKLWPEFMLDRFCYWWLYGRFGDGPEDE